VGPEPDPSEPKDLAGRGPLSPNQESSEMPGALGSSSKTGWAFSERRPGSHEPQGAIWPNHRDATKIALETSQPRPSRLRPLGDGGTAISARRHSKSLPGPLQGLTPRIFPKGLRSRGLSTRTRRNAGYQNHTEFVPYFGNAGALDMFFCIGDGMG